MTREEKQKAIYVLKNSAPVFPLKKPEEYNNYIQVIKQVIDWLEQEPTTRNCFGCKYSKDNHNAGTEECHLCMWENQYTPTTKNDLGVDCIDKWDIGGKEAELWIVKGKLQVRNRGTIHNIDLSSVTPQEPRWISVSERLPEANIYDGDGPVWKHEVLITGYLSFDDKKETFVNMAFAEDVRNKCVPNTNVTAWMPLPKAYRGVEE